jgi:hypothetical protein
MFHYVIAKLKKFSFLTIPVYLFKMGFKLGAVTRSEHLHGRSRARCDGRCSLQVVPSTHLRVRSHVCAVGPLHAIYIS